MHSCKPSFDIKCMKYMVQNSFIKAAVVSALQCVSIDEIPLKKEEIYKKE